MHRLVAAFQVFWFASLAKMVYEIADRNFAIRAEMLGPLGMITFGVILTYGGRRVGAVSVPRTVAFIQETLDATVVESPT